MQAIRAWYLETLQWKEKGIDPTLVVNSKRLRNIVKYVEKLSPFWDTLGVLFNHNKIGRPSVVYDTAQDVELKTSTFDSSSNDSNDVQLVLKYEATDPQYSTSQSSSDFTTTIVNRSTLETQTMPQSIMEATQTIADNCAATTTTTPPNTDASNRTGLIDDNLEFIKLEPDSPQPSMSQRSINFKLSPRETAQPSQNSQLIKEQNSTLEREKIELESEKLKIEREKLELEKEKVRNDFELKKLALQNEFELKKVEIALRVEADERLKRYEIDLKSC
ncbi:PREDICTED: myb/SANT-like DNA-binding domain-containing protein 4 [Rhagoletis zephyria]|uniref:myb/SANT-like DNA-binding domain-containing protein 4 n=1 Tax=Rhagoletis zephyria TaxID=28612 RepID=UPI0008113D6D|nr:PREDICTED: myb/SANT-like DNA-binding domain-containing protein 4 [Rhagoletis zephyria]XP_017492790.1 PREDICTED: myb/SANT-like DNA-binding domain-containing protein 4 [Rhagoletis zephyria]